MLNFCSLKLPVITCLLDTSDPQHLYSKTPISVDANIAVNHGKAPSGTDFPFTTKGLAINGTPQVFTLVETFGIGRFLEYEFLSSDFLGATLGVILPLRNGFSATESNLQLW